MITKKEQIIEYFKSGIKNKKEFKIGIEHEKFLFDSQNNKRIDYQKIKEMFAALLEFGWNPVLENHNIIGLNNGGKILLLNQAIKLNYLVINLIIFMKHAQSLMITYLS